MMDKLNQRLALLQGRRQSMLWLLAGLLLVIALWQLLSAVYFYQWAPAGQFSLVDVQRPAAARQWRWFGVKDTAVAAVVPETVQPARLKAKLLGVIQAPSGNVAVIDTGKRGQSQVFREGSSLASNVTVHKIEPRQVLINENGVIRRLDLEIQKSAPGSVMQVLEESSPSESSPEPAEQGASGDGDGGFSLRGVPASVLSGASLKPSDKVLSVAGTPFDQIMASPQDYQSLMSSDEISVEVMRDGRRQTVTVNPGQLMPGMMQILQNP